MGAGVVRSLPNGWTMTRLGDVLKFQPGFPFESTYFSPPGVGIRLIKNRDLRSDDSIVSYAGPIPAGYEVHNGDVLVGMDGDFEPILWTKGTALLNQRVGRIVPSTSVDSRWIALALVNPLKDLEQETGATTVKHLSHRDVEDLVIGMPALSEQRAIAAALSDAAAWVQSLDALIAKKRDMFAGTAQSLLEGHRRLPGFTSDWLVVPLSEIAEVTMGQSPPSSSYNRSGSGLPLIQGNADIVNRRTITRVWTSNPSKTAMHGEIIMTVRAPVGAIGVAQSHVCLGRGVCAIRAISVDDGFLRYQLQRMESDWESLSQGSTFTAANSTQVRGLTIAAPSSSDEQRAIAVILSDMDDEIEALVSQRDKAELIRQGMAQDLLSGKVRLV